MCVSGYRSGKIGHALCRVRRPCQEGVRAFSLTFLMTRVSGNPPLSSSSWLRSSPSPPPGVQGGGGGFKTFLGWTLSTVVMFVLFY